MEETGGTVDPKGERARRRDARALIAAYQEEQLRLLLERVREGFGRLGLLTLEGLAQGYGYDITGADVWTAYQHTMRAAELAGRSDEARDRIRQLAVTDGPAGFVTRVLAPELHR